MRNLIHSKTNSSSTQHGVGRATLSGLILVAVQLSSATAYSAGGSDGAAPAVDFTIQQVGEVPPTGLIHFAPTPIISGQVVNGVLGNGADSGTFEDGKPFDAYSFIATQPG